MSQQHRPFDLTDEEAAGADDPDFGPRYQSAAKP
jgi:hypothetical protein